MYTKTLLVAALALAVNLTAAGSSFADTGLAPDFSSVTSTLSRAEVTAEYVRAKQAGELKYLTGFSTASDLQGGSVLTRAEVQREYLRARDAGELTLAETAFGGPHAKRAMQ